MNGTNLTTEEGNVGLRVVEGVTFVIITLLILIGNCLCLLVLRLARSMNSVTRVLLISLTAADLLMGTVVGAPILGTVIANEWPYGYVFCAISASGNQICATTSLFSLLLINAERYVCISRPLRYSEIVTVNRARGAVVCVWIFALFLGLSNCFLPGRVANYHEYLHSCFFDPSSGNPDVMGTLCVILFVFAPFPVLILMYIRIFVIARRHAKDMEARAIAMYEQAQRLSLQENGRISLDQGRRRFFPEYKAAKTFGIITFTYAVAWMPFFCIVIYENLTLTKAPRGLTVTAACMALSNSWLNVLVYYVRNALFRDAAKDILSKCFHDRLHRL
ncbi:beta-4C adrenergic receptor-like [Acanthaster planci]|uniref:Beta-4C adrenergic receptor-like n=1 Tax=Acanthaster planci TaxID=133434 RepID=A0A8B7Z5H5_ACAPL|nr:beta-4C adrenergic receptor-like [Acanthaster planci]